MNPNISERNQDSNPWTEISKAPLLLVIGVATTTFQVLRNSQKEIVFVKSWFFTSEIKILS